MLKRSVCAMLALVICGCLVGAAAAQEPPEQPEGEDMVVMTVPAIQGAEVGAGAALVMEARTGRVLFAQNAEERLPFASTTKIMTALITLEQPSLDAVFTVDPNAIKVEGSSMGLQEGDQVTLRALAVGMLLSSGNDAANAAAVRIAGSTEAFVGMMNQRAQQLGLVNTSFETPSGLDGENHYSSAYDLALLARAALQNDHFAEICSQSRMRISYGNPPYDRWLQNHNKLLSYYDGTIGVKTGFTKKAGRCLVSAATKDGVTLICVTLDCPDDWNIHESLYDRLFPQLQVEDLAKNMPEVQIPVTGGTAPSVEALTYDSIQVPVPVSGADIVYDVRVSPFLYAPVQAGAPVGTVHISMDGAPLFSLTLIAGQDVPLLHPWEEETGFFAWLSELFS